MSDKRLRIYKGADKSFIVRIKSNKTDDPYSLDSITFIQVVFANADRSKLVLTTDVRPATRAFKKYESVMFKAQNFGALGNNIVLEFNGVDTIAEITTLWNDANPTNTVEHDANNDQAVLPSGNIRLNDGYDEYEPVQVYGEPKLGKLHVTMTEKETAKLRSGANNSFSVILDNGQNVGGSRNIGTFEQKVDIKEPLI